MNLHEGSKIQIKANSYTLKNQIGKGAFGTVYQGEDQNKQKVAIKIQKHISDSELKILNEMKTKKFKNLINTLDLETINNQIVIVMEYCSDNLFDHLVQNGNISPDKVRFIMKEIGNGIKEIHDLKYAHRDIKPENILIQQLTDEFGNKQDIYKICDFGTIKSQDVMTTQCVGTAYYIAPEQINSNGKEYSLKVDIWAFGVLIYELLTGQPMFNGRSQEEVWNRIKNIDQKVIDNIILNTLKIERKYRTLLQNMLQINIDKRYNIDQVIGELRGNSQIVPRNMNFLQERNVSQILQQPIVKQVSTIPQNQQQLNQQQTKNVNEKNGVPGLPTPNNFGKVENKQAYNYYNHPQNNLPTPEQLNRNNIQPFQPYQIGRLADNSQPKTVPINQKPIQSQDPSNKIKYTDHKQQSGIQINQIQHSQIQTQNQIQQNNQQDQFKISKQYPEKLDQERSQQPKDLSSQNLNFRTTGPNLNLNINQSTNIFQQNKSPDRNINQSTSSLLFNKSPDRNSNSNANVFPVNQLNNNYFNQSNKQLEQKNINPEQQQVQSNQVNYRTSNVQNPQSQQMQPRGTTPQAQTFQGNVVQPQFKPNVTQIQQSVQMQYYSNNEKTQPQQQFAQNQNNLSKNQPMSQDSQNNKQIGQPHNSTLHQGLRYTQVPQQK